jgi:pimeloyl-ACP methyl ester carboxylesterase
VTEPGFSHRSGSGEPMLLVHGITDTWRTWELVLPHLEPHHDCLAITLLGHSGGRALGEDGAVTHAELVDEAERDMDAAGFETAHIVGNSLGGWVALELAARGRARSVVALSPAGGWDPGNRWALASYWQLVVQQRLLSLTKPAAMDLAVRPRGRWVVLGGLVSDPPAVPAGLARALVAGAADCPAALPLLLESKADGYPDLAEIECPVRIAWGSRDLLLPVKHVSARFRHMLPQADWVDIPGAGHLPQIDHPEEVARLVLEVSSGMSG